MKIGINTQIYKNASFNFGKKNSAIYGIDKQGSWTKYSNVAELRKLASENLNPLSFYSLNDVPIVNDDGSVYIMASGVEDENHQVDIDKLSAIRQKQLEKAFYTVDKDGNCEKYYAVKSAARVFKQTKSSIFSLICGENRLVNGKKFIAASKLEDENGNIDAVKLFNAMRIFNKAVYRCDRDGNLERYENVEEAAEKNNMEVGSVKQILRGTNRVNQNKLFFTMANEIERISADGKVYIDEYELSKHIHRHYCNEKFTYFM